MTTQSTRLSWMVIVGGALGLLLVGAGSAYLWMRSPVGSPAASQGSEESAAVQPAAGPASSAEPAVTLTPEVIARAGITVAAVQSGTSTSTLRLPAVVEANAYRQVTVTPLVAGKVTSVDVQLGDRVRRGQRVAQVFSPELAEAHARYTSLQAELLAAEQELGRTERLAKIGAASQQELERVRAQHSMRAAAVEEARSTLTLFGATPAASAGGADHAKATIDVPAPLDGTVTERKANPGLNVDASTPLLTIVDLDSVWVVSDVQERDLARVRVGGAVLVVTTARPDAPIRGRVSYIDPQIHPETRTARARVVVPNPGHALRLGQYAEMVVDGPAGVNVPMVPRSALQMVGSRNVVYVAAAGEPRRFLERAVQVRESAGDHVEVLSGLQPGELVVTTGSFFVRAERERLGPRRPDPGPSTRAPEAPSAAIKITVDDRGFEPARINLRAGVPVRLAFIRTSDKSCATEVAVPSLGIRRALPLNQAVEIEIVPKAGEVEFVCGMNMLRGVLVVK